MARTIKLRYDFNTANLLEVEYKPGSWTRVTPNEFRSRLGNRRIEGKLYTGPVYYENTNFVYEPVEGDQSRTIKVTELNDLSLVNKYKIRTLDMEPYVLKANRY